MKCTVETVHHLLHEAHEGRSDAAIQLCDCFTDEMRKLSKMLPEKARQDGEQRACLRLILESTKKIYE
ncbi:hypothetical protein [Sulfoacidibacillus ferrooxidans]|uniref:Uncharacterized protein n=1 Tax=Sulfoacidibacillus ferrooxidans TaxID=2005001 RepID=A0A9X1VBG2_9BACL|nr:hypothetical protein [Sulfoacidibacillus ferrooxidans]MCI0184784.1 hypothetical protein [Sulfoacidibacillus ferrooxidans]